MGEEIDREEVQKYLHCLTEVCFLPPENVKSTDKELEDAEGFIVSKIQMVRAAKKKLEEGEQRAQREKDEEEQKKKAQDARKFGRSQAIVKDQNIEKNDEKLMPTTNTPRVDFISFIEEDGEYLMLRKHQFPMDKEVRNEQLRFPLGVVYDEETKNWIISDCRLNKIWLMNVESQSLKICQNLKIQSPSAVVVYTEGDSVAVLCSQSSKNRNKHNIYIYKYTSKEDLITFASYTDEKFDMRSQLRGLAKSVAGNIISLESGSIKRLRVFKKGDGGKGFEIKGASRPSFLATYRSTVAVSDLGVNKVFIIILDDTKWDDVAFSLTRVLYSTPEPDLRMDIFVDQTGFKFVAGMQFDINGHLLIGDAKGHTIKLYDTDFDFLHRISSDFPLPYMSSFHINSKGECVILDVHGEKKLHWMKMESLDKMLPWLPGEDLPPREESVRRPRLPQGLRRGGFQNKHF